MNPIQIAEFIKLLAFKAISKKIRIEKARKSHKKKNTWLAHYRIF